MYPIHIGNAILHLSKLLLVKFITFLEQYLIEDSFRLVYTGEHNLEIEIILRLRHRLGCNCHGRRNGQLRQAESSSWMDRSAKRMVCSERKWSARNTSTRTHEIGVAYLQWGYDSVSLFYISLYFLTFFDLDCVRKVTGPSVMTKLLLKTRTHWKSPRKECPS